jgi:hypothetical protein
MVEIGELFRQKCFIIADDNDIDFVLCTLPGVDQFLQATTQ